VTTLLGLDIGTTGCKAVLFDADGTLLAGASREYAVDLPRPGWAEQDIERVWMLAQEAMGEAIRTARVLEVAAIGLSVHGEAVTPVDVDGRALRPTILGMDTRTEPQNEWLRERVGEPFLVGRTGMPMHTINTLPKLLWIRDHEPEIWRDAAGFLLVEGYLLQRMTGTVATSDCLASRTQLFNTVDGGWDPEILGAIGLDERRLGALLPSGSAVARLRDGLTAALGLRRAPLVVTGGHDQACGALGAGVTQPGLACVSTGTAEVVEVALPAPVLDPVLAAAGLSVYRHVVPGMYLAMTLNHSGGLSLRWFRDEFCEPQRDAAAAAGRDAYELILAGAPEGPTDLLVMPHFAGSGTPRLDPSSRAAIVGLTFATGRGEIARAILEGLTFELRANLDLLAGAGVDIGTLRAIGGGARSPLWLQLKADITGIPVAVPHVTEAAGLGAALLAGVGAGVFPSAAAAADASLHIAATVTPDPVVRRAYAERYRLYRDLHDALAPFNRGLRRRAGAPET
jgi:xylulokinase